jgi:hypothetical protein
LLDLMQVVFQPLGGHTNLFQHCGDYAFAVFHQRQQQVHGQHFRVAELAGPRLCCLHCLLRFHRQFFPANCHIPAPSRLLLAPSPVLSALERPGSPFTKILFLDCLLRKK